jgi:uncharacterized phage-like protein YoqJ
VIPLVNARLDELIPELIGKGFTRFLAGGAIGFDTLAAQAVVRTRELYPDIKLIIVQPCKDQEARWNEYQIAEYWRILEQADEVICLSDHYYDGCMQARNRYLAENSGLCVAYMCDGHSGTGYTVKQAKIRDIPVINLGMI